MKDIEIISEQQHAYFTTIPNIVFELGLKANELAVYLAIYRTVGEPSKGKCIKSIKRLSAEAGVSEKTFKDIKKFLCKVNPVIKKPLIKVTPRKSKDGDCDTDLILVTDIWLINMQHFTDPAINKKNAIIKSTKMKREVGSKVTPGVGVKKTPGVGSF